MKEFCLNYVTEMTKSDLKEKGKPFPTDGKRVVYLIVVLFFNFLSNNRMLAKME